MPLPFVTPSIAAGLLAAGLLAAPLPVAAQAPYPARPVKAIVSFPPGGPLDLMARAIGEKLAASMQQPFVIENRGGAGGNIGADAAARSAPDGHTLLFIKAALRSQVAAALAMPEVRARLTAMDLEPSGETGEAISRRLDELRERYAAPIRRTGMKVE